MGDQFLLCTLHLKLTRYAIVNPMYNNSARDLTTANEMRTEGCIQEYFSVCNLEATWARKNDAEEPCLGKVFR